MTKYEFLGDDFLLCSNFAQNLFHKYAKHQKIIDYHCHLEPKVIYENLNPENITKLWISEAGISGPVGDHYKWRLMRAAGYSEREITGEGSDWEKFNAFAHTLEQAVGNPIYEWSHLELKRFFNISEPLNAFTAEKIWSKLNQLLQTDAFKPRNIIANANVEVIVTTDDPIDSLQYHELLAQEEKRFRMLPAWRPDKVLNIFKADFVDYISRLSAVVGQNISSLTDLERALESRLNFFATHGAKLADHGVETFYYAKSTASEVDVILTKRLSGAVLSTEDVAKYHTYMQKFMAKQYAKRNWVMQLHINSIRDLNSPALEKLGPNTGFDSIADVEVAVAARNFFDDLEVEAASTGEDTIPRTMLYSLNANDWMTLTTVGACHLQNVGQIGVKQKFQLGPAWWFNDTHTGMLRQLEIFAEGTLLGNFTGMLTDSRSLLSYTRHEYFRRCLCEYFGGLATRGQIPSDLNQIGKVVANICYNNAKDYFML